MQVIIGETIEVGPMEKRDQLVQDLDDARAQMAGVLAGIDTTMELYPGWTIKHVLAHITGWDEATIDSLKAHAQGTESSVPAYRGIDDYNAKSVETRELLSYGRVYREWEKVREELKDVLRTMPPEKFSQDLLFPWSERGAIDNVIRILVHHEKEHAQEIQALLDKNQGQ